MMREQGMSYKDIANEFGLSMEGARGIIKREKDRQEKIDEINSLLSSNEFDTNAILQFYID